MREYGRVVVDMMRYVSNFSARNYIKPDVVVVARKSEKAVAKEERFLRGRLLDVPTVVALSPAWAVPIVVVVTALATLEGLPAVDDAELVDGAVISCPRLLARNVFPSNLHKRFAHTVEDRGGIAEALAPR